MSTKTENYQLKLWDRDTEGLEEALNENFAKLDGALAGGIVTGRYTGNLENYQDINLGFSPRAVLVMMYGTEVYCDPYLYGGMALKGIPAVKYGETAIEVTDTGFRIYLQASASREIYTELNRKNPYHYVAFR